VTTYMETSGKISWRSDLKLFTVSCIFASILDFAEFVHFGFVSCTVAFLPPPLTNTSTSMIRVTHNMGRSAENRRGNDIVKFPGIVREFHIVWRVVTLE